MQETLPGLAAAKMCFGCRETKPLTAFHKHSIGRGGLKSRCIDCRAAEKRAYRLANEKLVRARDAEYRRRNRDRHLAYNKAWNGRNRDRCDEATLRWRARNVELVQAQRHRRRGLKRNAAGAGYATSQKVVDRVRFYANKCFYCAEDADTIDHRIPLARGGSALPANLVPACRSCNSRKRTRTQTEFFELLNRS